MVLGPRQGKPRARLEAKETFRRTQRHPVRIPRPSDDSTYDYLTTIWSRLRDGGWYKKTGVEERHCDFSLDPSAGGLTGGPCVT